MFWRVDSTLKGAGETPEESDVENDVVLVVAEKRHERQQERQRGPEYARVVDHEIAADAVAQVAAGHLRDRIAVEKTRQQCCLYLLFTQQQLKTHDLNMI